MSEVIEAIVDAVATDQFLAGFRWGVILAAAGLVGSLIWRRWRNERAPFAGLAAVVAASIAMPVARPRDTGLVMGLALLALAGAFFPWARRVPLLASITAFPGAWFIARSALPESGWVIPLIFGVTILSGPVIAWFDRTATTSPLPMLLFAISIVGVWVTVPDTEEVLVLLGAITAPSLAVWPLGLGRLGPIGAYALGGLFMWVIAWGGRGRPGSIVGAAAALGMLLAAPVAAWIARKGAVTRGGWVGPSLLVLHALVVAVVARIAGAKTDALDAAVVVLPAVTAATLVWLVVERLAGATPRQTISP